MNTKQRILWVDALNVLACAGVVLLHSTNKEIHAFDGNVSAEWILGLLTHSLVLWPVDVFFMISGYTLLSGLKIESNGGGVITI